MRRIALLAVGFGLLIGADLPNKEDRERLQGTWTMASVVIDGMAVPAREKTSADAAARIV